MLRFLVSTYGPTRMWSNLHDVQMIHLVVFDGQVRDIWVIEFVICRKFLTHGHTRMIIRPSQFQRVVISYMGVDTSIYKYTHLCFCDIHIMVYNYRYSY